VTSQACLLHLASGVDLEVPTESIDMAIEKELNAVRDDGNVTRVQDSNRTQRIWSATLILTTSQRNTVVQYYRTATTAPYPSLRYFDKDTSPFYTEYLVYFGGYHEKAMSVGTSGKWSVTLTLKERTS
jgi:hypothetical protein